jgi:type I restriction enzyme, S subunit
MAERLMKETELGPLPDSWEVVPLGRVVKRAQYGLSIRGERQGVYPILRMNNLRDGRVAPDDLQFVDLDPQALAAFRLSPGDILFNRTNSFELVGKAALFDLPGEFVFASYLIRLSVDPGGALPDYLNFYLNADRTQERLKLFATRGVSQSNINATKLQSLSVALPPLPEQRAIARALRAVQEARDARRREAALERERKAELMQHLFTRGTRGESTRQTEIGEVPESWRVVRLGEVARTLSGGTPDRANPAYWNGGTIPWVKTAEINYNVIRATEEKITPQGLENSSARIIPAGTLLMAMFGQGVTRGRVAILGIDAAINQACVAVVLEKGLSTPFLFHFLAYSYHRIRSLGHGAHQKNLNAALIRSVLVPVPSADEQAKIALALDACDRKIAATGTERELLDELFRALLEELVTGRLSAVPLIGGSPG